MARVVLMVGSLALLGAAGWASWTGVGSVSSDATPSARSGSVGGVFVGGARRIK